MDGFTGHEKSLDTLEEVLKKYNITILFIPPHTSDQVQPLNLFGFNLQKSKTQKHVFNHHYSLQTNQILAILEGLDEIRSYHAITTAWQMAGIFKTRSPEKAIPNDIFLQEHIIDINRNKKIRNLNSRSQTLQGSQNKLRKYEVLKPDQYYPKRKELKLSTPEQLLMEKLTIEEANEIKKKYSIRRFTIPTKEPNNHLITEYSTLRIKQGTSNKRGRKRKPSSLHRVATLRIPPDA